jgi:hypothetical protein
MNESRHIERNNKKWDKWAINADGKGLIFDYLRRTQENLITLLDIKEHVNILDIGCGTGWALSAEFAQLIADSGLLYLRSEKIGPGEKVHIGEKQDSLKDCH